MQDSETQNNRAHGGKLKKVSSAVKSLEPLSQILVQ